MLISSVWRGTSLRWFNSGLLLGGSFMAFSLYLVSAVILRPWWSDKFTEWIFAASVVALFLREVGIVHFKLPQNARLVPQKVVDAGPRAGALQFGFEMGTGIRTYVTSSLPYLLVLMVFLSASAMETLLAGIGFGAGRALMSTTRSWSRSVNKWDLELAREEQLLRIWTYVLGALAVTIAVTSN